MVSLLSCIRVHLCEIWACIPLPRRDDAAKHGDMLTVLLQSACFPAKENDSEAPEWEGESRDNALVVSTRCSEPMREQKIRANRISQRDNGVESQLKFCEAATSEYLSWAKRGEVFTT